MAWPLGKSQKPHVAALHARLTHSFGRVREDTTNLYAWITHLNNKIDYLHHQHRQNSLLLQQVDAKVPNQSSITHQLDEHPGWSHLSGRIAQTEARLAHIVEMQNQASAASLQLTSHIGKMPQMQFQMHEQIAQLHERISRIQAKLGDPDYAAHMERLEAQVNRLKAEIEPIRSQVFESHHKQIEALKEKIAAPEQQPQPRPALQARLMSSMKRNSRAYAQSMILSYVRKYGKISVQQLREMLVDEQAILSKSAFYRHVDEVEKLDEVAMVKDGKNKLLFYQPKSMIE